MLALSLPRTSTAVHSFTVIPRRLKHSFHEYIHPVSIIPTFHFQPSLPRLKIPELDVTLNKYSEVVQPLVNPEQYSDTKRAIEEFRTGDGKRLQKDLVDLDNANQHTSYISDIWYDMYLSDRVPLPINYNPQITLNEGPHVGKWSKASRAAALVGSALRFYNSLKDEVLEPDLFHTKPLSKHELYQRLIRLTPASLSYYVAYFAGAYALDMSQYARLFSTTRIPMKGKDQLETFKNSRHIVVIRRNNFYKMDVFDDNGKAFSEESIMGAFKHIIHQNDPVDPFPIGVLTTENRDTWANLRSQLQATNKESLHVIDSALFVICLDNEDNTDLPKLSRNFLVGDGRNRWFDKSFSLIFTKNGKAAVNFEHSWGDGIAVVRFLDEIAKDSNKRHPPEHSNHEFQKPTLLKWNLTEDLKRGIHAAEKRFDEDQARMDLKILTTSAANREQIKKAKVSPDGFLQMSFQLAYYRLYKKTVSTYESATTAGFKLGRTECIRTVSNESVAFTKAFTDPSVSLQKRGDLLRTAINVHAGRSRQALLGQGVDRHLFALRKLYEKQNPSKLLPAIFTDKAYSIMNHNTLSTSTLESPNLEGGGFGPVVPDGFGIGYGMEGNFMRFNVTAFNPLPLDDFLSNLEESLHLMKQALEASPPPQNKN